MRNFKTSFVKNAIRFFANEASQTLRAISDPATLVLSLMQSTVRTILQFVIRYRLSQIQSSLPVNVTQGTLGNFDRIASVMPGYGLGGEHGNRQRDCRLGLAVS